MVKIVLMSVPPYVLKNRIRLDDGLVCAQWERREFAGHKTKAKKTHDVSFMSKYELMPFYCWGKLEVWGFRVRVKWTRQVIYDWNNLQPRSWIVSNLSARAKPQKCSRPKPDTTSRFCWEERFINDSLAVRRHLSASWLMMKRWRLMLLSVALDCFSLVLLITCVRFVCDTLLDWVLP